MGESLCGAKTAGFSLEDAKPCSPGRKVAHWLKGGEWDAQSTIIFPAILPHATIVVPPALETEYRSRGRRALASVPHHNQVLRLDLGLLDLATLLHEEDT